MNTAEPNQITIHAYDQGVRNYILNTPNTHQSYHQPMLRWIDAAVADLSGKKVLEIGSATPRDATYIRKRGFEVQTSDASEGFVQYLRGLGDNTILLNVLTDPIPTGYDLIFANAVASHFTQTDMVKFLDKATASLQPASRLAFNVKLGTGEAWINEKIPVRRFIHFWQPEDIRSLLDARKLKVIFFESNVAGDIPSHRWINIIVQK